MPFDKNGRWYSPDISLSYAGFDPEISDPSLKWKAQQVTASEPEKFSLEPESEKPSFWQRAKSFFGDITRRAQADYEWQKAHPVSEEELTRRMGRLAAQPGETPSLRNIERVIARAASETAFMTPSEAPRPSTGIGWLDKAAELVGTGLGFISPLGAASKALEAGSIVSRLPAVERVTEKLTEKAAPAVERVAAKTPERIAAAIRTMPERAVRGGIMGGVYGTAAGLAEGEKPSDVAKSALENIALFAGLEAGLPVAGAGVGEAASRVASRLREMRGKLPPREAWSGVVEAYRQAKTEPAPSFGKIELPKAEETPKRELKDYPDLAAKAEAKPTETAQITQTAKEIADKIRVLPKKGVSKEEFRQRLLTMQEQKKLAEAAKEQEKWEKLLEEEGMGEPETVSLEAMRERELAGEGAAKRKKKVAADDLERRIAEEAAKAEKTLVTYKLEDIQKAAPQLATGLNLQKQNLPTRMEDVTVRDIINTISKGLGIPVRVGRFRQLARAIYKVRPEVIRSRLAT